MTKVVGCNGYMYGTLLSNVILLKGKLLDPVICEYFLFSPMPWEGGNWENKGHEVWLNLL